MKYKKIVLSILIIVALLSSILYKISTKTSFFDWQQIVLLVLFSYVLLEESIMKIIINKDGISLEKQVSRLYDAFNQLESFSTRFEKKYLKSLVKEISNSYNDTISRIILCRLTLRVLLRKICEAYKIELESRTSMIDMISELKKTSNIDIAVLNNAEFIRRISYYFEWPSDTKPSMGEIEKALKITPEVFIQIFQEVKKIEIKN